LADAELQPLSVRGGEDFTVDFTFVHDHFLGQALWLGQARGLSAVAAG